MHKILLDDGHKLLCENNRKSKFSNGENSVIYTTKCLCSRALDFPSATKFCKSNNDLFIAQDGSIKLCRLLNDEINILKEIKDRNDANLIKKIKLSFKKLGNGCPYERK